MLLFKHCPFNISDSVDVRAQPIGKQVLFQLFNLLYRRYTIFEVGLKACLSSQALVSVPFNSPNHVTCFPSEVKVPCKGVWCCKEENAV